MGGGDKPKEEAGKNGDPSAACPALVMEAVSEYMKVPATLTEMTVMAKLRARLQPDEERRAPITICAAIDRSSSMKDHLPLLKETLQFMMQQLRAEDMLYLVTFDHEVYLKNVHDLTLHKMSFLLDINFSIYKNACTLQLVLLLLQSIYIINPPLAYMYLY